MACIQIDGLNINYERSGSGKPVVLLHGWGCDLSVFADLHTRLAQDFDVTSPDFPGFGKSDPPKDVWGVYEYTDMLEKFLNEIGVTNPILLGHSFGGRVAILYSSRNKVHKTILVDSAGVKPARSLRYYIKVYSYKAVKKLMPLFMGREKADRRIERARNRNASEDYKNAKGIMRQVLVKVVNEDLRHVMPSIEAPTLLVWGSNDTATTVKDARKMEKLIKGSGLVVFDGAGHYSFLDQPYRFNAVIDSFLSEDKTTGKP